MNEPVNKNIVDRYTYGHFGVGMFIGAWNAPEWLAVLIAVGYEIIEHPIKQKLSNIFPTKTDESFKNAAMDAVTMYAGYKIVKELCK